MSRPEAASVARLSRSYRHRRSDEVTHYCLHVAQLDSVLCVLLAEREKEYDYSTATVLAGMYTCKGIENSGVSQDRSHNHNEERAHSKLSLDLSERKHLTNG